MEKNTGLEIAVIGMAGRFPGADSIAEFWENLKNGKNCISTFSEEEALAEGEPASLLRDPSYVKANAWLHNKQYFDAAFFNYRPDEAALMDPQIRVFHECCWEALEDSGYSPAAYKDKIGLFAAASANAAWVVYAHHQNREGLVDDFTASLLRDTTFLCSTIAYKFNLRGPALFLQTACSSSLVAVHEACNSLLMGECSMALAGGVQVLHYSKKGYLYKEGMIRSKDGTCRPFDSEASGTVGGEGAGVVVLKRLKDALRDGDPIRAIIKGTAINNDGDAKVGFTAPSVKGQAEVIRKALKMSGIDPGTISYIEAHGTATELGDPVEVEALNTVFGKSNARSCALGSVKSNIGHLDSAAGVAGLIKTVLALQHKQLPPSLHYRQPNPKIDFENGPLYVNHQLAHWKNSAAPLRAGVSSFGIGGTNAHIILEEAPVSTASSTGRNHQLIVLSAQTKESLHRATQQLAGYLKTHQAVSLPDLAYTLQCGRERFRFRKIFVSDGIEPLQQGLMNAAAGDATAAVVNESLQHIIFLFSGQGAQYVNMCRDLYQREKVFKEILDECFRIAQQYSAVDLREILFPGSASTAENAPLIHQTQYAQPLLFFIEYAMARLLMSWGIRPDYMIGHSIGEYVAACISGVFGLQDAIRLVIKRGELMSKAEKGSMLSIRISETAAKALLHGNDRLDISVINSDASLVVSGQHHDIEQFEQQLIQQGYQAKKLHTSHAFHSWMMEQVLMDFERVLTEVTIHPPAIPYMSNLTGELVQYDEIRQPAYWSKHLRHTVQFNKGVTYLLQQGSACCIEVGPGRSLCNYVQENTFKKSSHQVINMIRHAQQQVNDQQYLMEKLGACWLQGLNIDWNGFYAAEKRNRIALPTYSFEKTIYPTNFNIQALLNGHSTTTIKEQTSASSLYTSTWKRAMMPSAITANKATTYLIISDKNGFSDYIIRELTAAGAAVIAIQQGASFKAIHKERLELDLSDVDSSKECWQWLRQEGITVEHIIDCRLLTNGTGYPRWDDIDERLQDGYLGVSILAQSIARSGISHNLHITVLANQLSAITENESIDPLKALVHAPVKIIPSEMSQLRCKVIDLPFPFLTDETLKDYAKKVCREIHHTAEEPFVAYRFGQRWTPLVEAVETQEATSSGVRIRKDGTYLITGGFGGMGFSVAKDLVHRHGANVVLVHRSSFPARHNWDQWLLEKGKEDDISKKIVAIQEMESTGHRVHLNQADLSQPQAIEDCIAGIMAQAGTVNGLIWAAGEIDYGGIIMNRSREAFTNILSSKVHGLLLFEQYLDFKQLDFVALFSSIGNLFYQIKFGQVAYNAANEFLDAFAQYTRQRYGIHAFSINWCDWLDVGMTIRSIQQEEQTNDLRTVNPKVHHGIYPDEGVSAFHQCLQHNAAFYAIYKDDLFQALQLHKERLQEVRKQLASPSGEATASILPEESLEQTLLEVFAAFFGNKDWHTHSDFFEEGGDSLKAMTLVARINQRTGIHLSIGDLYNYPTIAGILKAVTDRQVATKRKVIPRAPEQSFYPLSSAQKRMYFLQVLDRQSTLYNEILLFRMHGIPDKPRLEAAFRQLIARHESLRTAFVQKGDQPVQYIHPEVSFSLEAFMAPEHAMETIIHDFMQPFELDKAPLIRAGLVAMQPDEHLLMISLHHIVADGISQGILLRDLVAFYNEAEASLPSLTIQYKDLAVWQEQPGRQDERMASRNFWIQQFAGKLSPIALPLDLPRPVVKKYTGSSIEFRITPEETRQLQRIATTENTSLFIVLLSIYNILLAKLSGAEDLTVGTMTAGREHADLEPVIGMFINMLPLRSYPKEELRYQEYLSEVKAHTLACFDQQAYPYEELVEELKLARTLNRNPLFDVVFSYNKVEAHSPALNGLTFTLYQRAQSTCRFDLILWASEFNDQLSFQWEYSTELFRKESVERFANCFRTIIAAVAADPQTRISNINIITSSYNRNIFNEIYTYAVKDADDSNDLIPASYHQERLWFIDQFESGYLYDAGPVYHNIPLIIEMKGNIDLELLEESWRLLVQQYDVLRTGIVTIHDRPFQQIHTNPRVVLEQQWQDENEEDNAATINRFCLLPFELNGPLVRAKLFRSGAEQQVLVVVFHHIIADRYSVKQLAAALWNIYRALVQGERVVLSAPQLHYTGFTLWQQQSLPALEFYFMAYWKRALNGKVKALELPTSRPRAAVHTFTAASVPVHLPAETVQSVLDYGSRNKIETSIILMAAFKLLLHKYARHEEIVIGTSIDNREEEGMKTIIGPVANLMVLRSFITPGRSFDAFLQELQQQYEEALQYGAMPFDKLVKELAPEKDMARTALFDVLFQYEDGIIELPAIEGLQARVCETNLGYGKYDLNLFLQRNEHDIQGTLVFNLDYFDTQMMQDFLTHYYELLRNALAAPGAEMSSIQLLSAAERARLLHSLNNNDVAYPASATIVSLFREQARKYGTKEAIRCGNEHISYAALDERSDQLAVLLQKHGVQRGDINGLLMDRSIETVIGMLGILKAGGAYLPIDVDYPASRIDFMMEDSGMRLVVSTASCKGNRVYAVPVVCMEDAWNITDVSNLVESVAATDLCYVIYTSGTTGTPKGVMIEHRNVVRLFFNDKPLFDFGSSDVWTMFHSHCFDFSVWEIYGALLFGGKLIIIPKLVAMDTHAFLQIVKDEGVTILNQTPTAFYNLIQEDLSAEPKSTGLRYVIFGGEALSPGKLQAWHERYPEVKLINMFGITETTVHVTYKEIKEEEIKHNISNVGKPIPTLSVYILDPQQQPVPKGVTGELYVGGAGVSRGYLGRPELTAQRFVPDVIKPHEKMYRSGDLARILSTGEIEYIGRADQQVQLRGFRIELGEIESQLRQHDRIREAVVIARTEGDHQYLIGYYVSNQSIGIGELRQFLSARLPDYMVPAYFVPLQTLPLTSNGKLDKEALPGPSIQHQHEYHAARTKEEELLVEIWSGVLGIPAIGITDNFFSIGGDSIKSIQISARVRSAGYELSVKDIFTSQTIRELAPKLKLVKSITDQSIITGHIPLTPIQQWFFEGPITRKSHFNQSVLLHFTDHVSEEAIRQIFLQLQLHHDALRMVYKQVDNQYVQENLGHDLPLSLDCYNWKYAQDPALTIENIAHQLQSSIDLERGPLMKLALFHLKEGSRLLIIIHHLIIDGVSWRILLEDLNTLHQQLLHGQPLALPMKPHSYQAWSNALYGYMNSQQYLQAQQYWNSFLWEGAIIQRDHPNAHNITSDVERASFRLSSMLTTKLLTQCHEAFRTQINDLLLTGLLLALEKHSGITNTIVEVEGHGREEVLPDLNISRTIGWFTSIYPVWLQKKDGELSATIRGVKETLRKVPHHGFDYLLQYYSGEESRRKNTSRILFNYLGQFDAASHSNTFSLLQETTGHDIAPNETRVYDWEVSGIITHGQLQINIDSSRAQYNPSTIQTVLQHYQTSLEELIHYCCTYGKKILSPSDLTYTALPITQLDQLQEIYQLEDIYPLSPMQEGMLFHALIDAHSDDYFEQVTFRMNGTVNVEAIEKSMNDLVDRYDVLRTVFLHTGYQRPLQIVLAKRNIEFQFHDLREACANGSRADIVTNYRLQDKARKFDLGRDVLMRLTVLQTGASTFELIWNYHHILMDGWCIGLLVQDFKKLYAAHLQGIVPVLPRVEPYATYIKWLEQKDRTAGAAYWKNYLASYEKPASIPKKEISREETLPFDLKAHHMELSLPLTGSLQEISRKQGVTLNTLLQAAWGILLAKYNNVRDVVFGTVYSGRPPEINGIETMVGLFINTVPVRIQYQPQDTISDLLQSIQNRALETVAHHYSPLSEIQSLSELGRGLLDHLFIFENFPVTDTIENNSERDHHSNSYTITGVQVFEQMNYDLCIVVLPLEPLKIVLYYNANRYDAEIIKRTSLHFRQVIEQVACEATATIATIDLLSATERQQILHDFNNTQLEYPAGETVLDLIAEQVKTIPGTIAVRSEITKPLELWPSVAEYFIYDDLLYHAMTNDAKRNAWYRQDISRNVQNKVVVEVGTGPNAILSRFCVEAGAKKVYAIEVLEETYLQAKQFVASLGLENTIEVIHGDATTVTLPEEADVCVSELVGPIGGCEGAAVILNNARRFLKSNGIMLPAKTITHIAPVSLPAYFVNAPKFSGLSRTYVNKVFNYLGNRADMRICLRNFSSAFLLSEAQLFEDLDFTQPQVPEQSQHQIEFTIQRNDTLQGFIVWLNLSATNDEVLNILDFEYCWLPVFVPVFYPGITVQQGDVIKATITRTLCENGINPDFTISGQLEKSNGELIPFHYELPHFPKKFRSNAFYEKIFGEEGQADIYGNEKLYQDLTYEELDKRADQVAHYLRELGVNENNSVAMLQYASCDTMINILGILKTGAAYLPLDPKWPATRIQAILEESKPAACFTNHQYKEEILDHFVHSCPLLLQEQLYEKLAPYTAHPAPVVSEPHHTAYLIYTSGSTGKPKGVAIPHRGLYNMIKSMEWGFRISRGATVLQFASLGFDASICEIFSSLGTGATLFIYNREPVFSNTELYEVLKNQLINVVVLPPSVLKYLPDEQLYSLHTVISAGEACDQKIIERWKQQRRFVNAYGPTEYSVCTSMNIMDEPDPIHTAIGKPIYNTTVMILGLDNELQPVHIPGELCVAGEGIAKGYVCNETLTDKKFVNDPFHPGEKMYRTGDWARWLPDGNIEFLGRIDHQVKIRGNRIELEDIENQLLKIPFVKEAAVTAIRKDDDHFLVAYYAADEEPGTETMRNHLATNLPDYMIPSYFVRLDQLPLTNNGKLDRKALPDPSIESITAEQALPSNETEEKLAAIWATVLSTDKSRISIHANFFESGGHSLKLIQLCKMINDTFHTNISVAEMFRLPTITSIAAYLLHGDQEVQQKESLLAKAQDEIDENLKLVDDLLSP